MSSEHDVVKEGFVGSEIGRRELIKLGAGVVMASALSAPAAKAQETSEEFAFPPGSMPKPGDLTPFTGPGYTNNFNRLAKNGPMDDTTRTIVSFVRDFDKSKISPSATKAFNLTMIDSMAALVGAFEEESCRIAAKVAQLSPAGEMKCTVLGYGVQTTPELATFANGCLIRMMDFNDNVGGDHVSTLIPAAMAIGEALHSTGTEVMESVVIGYELATARTGGEAVTAAMVAGKLMKLDEEHLANAVTIALTPHVALNKGVGALSMWKGVRSAESAKCGVWAAMLARAGMTGPPQPFEGKGGLWSTGSQPGTNLTLPQQPDTLVIDGPNHWFKKSPAEGSTQNILVLMPEIRAWVKPDEINSIHFLTSINEETCDAPKWDPRNHETADHSMPYVIARALLDGEVYLDSYTEEKFMDPAARALMAKTTIGGVQGWEGPGVGRLTITKKTGESKYWDTYEGKRVIHTTHAKPGDNLGRSEDETKRKFDRALAFKKVGDAQREQAYKVWSNLEAIHDFADAMKTMARFGQPKPL